MGGSGSRMRWNWMVWTQEREASEQGGCRVGGMLRQRAVARFTGHVRVFAGGPGFGLVRVTKNTGILPGESDRVRADQFERAGPVVAILAECLGDDRAADGKEDSQSGDEDDSRPGQMSGIAKQVARHCPLFLAGIDPPGVDAEIERQ